MFLKNFFLWLLFQKILKLAYCKNISSPMNLLNKTNLLTDFYVEITFYIKISKKNSR